MLHIKLQTQASYINNEHITNKYKAMEYFL